MSFNFSFTAYIDVQSLNHVQTTTEIHNVLRHPDYPVYEYEVTHDFDDFVRVYFSDADDASNAVHCLNAVL